MNLGTCAQLPLSPVTGTWYRAADPRFVTSPLHTAHTAVRPGRYNAGRKASTRYEVLYLCESWYVAQLETGAIFETHSAGGPLSNPEQPVTQLICQVALTRVVDLAEEAVQRQLGTTAQELTGDWRGYDARSPRTSVRSPTGLAPTQALSEALYLAPGVEGFLSVSARNATRKTLMVFPGKLQPGSFVRYVDPQSGALHQLP